MKERQPRRILLVRHLETPRSNARDDLHQDLRFKEMESLMHNPQRTAMQTDRMKYLAEKLKEDPQYKIDTADTHLPILSGEHDRGRRLGQAIAAGYGHIDEIRFSPLRRAVQTKDAIVEGGKLDSVPQFADWLLVERDHGDAIFYPKATLFRAAHPEEVEKHRLLGDRDYPYPHGESKNDVRRRARKELRMLNRRRYRGKTMLLVSHNQTITEFVAVIERMTPEEFKAFDDRDPIQTGSVVAYEEVLRPRWQLWQFLARPRYRRMSDDFNLLQ